MSVETVHPITDAVKDDTVASHPPRDATGFPPLAEKLAHFVFDRTEGMVRNLRVTVHDDDKIVLTGIASSYYAKQLATHAIFDAMPGSNLSNRIRVGTPSP